jgi:1,4-dihydroxy-2-naphthoate polyprenyltransferase
MVKAIELQKLANTTKLLRFPFSVFLLPITLFSFYYIRPESGMNMILVLFIWHLLVYPSSNGYNSYHDKDEGPIGGLEKPPVPEKHLFSVCNVMDVIALILSLLINVPFTVFVLVYIITSRLYSNRKVRLKKYPLIGFLTVTIFQGPWIFAGNLFAFGKENLLLNENIIYSLIVCSGFIGCIYPLTQIYQHEADKKDNVTTLSIILGEKGTFVFSGLMFSIAAFFLYLSFSNESGNKNFLMFNLVMLPSLLYFLWWTKASFKDRTMINFRNTMRMLVLSSLLNNIFFLILLFK